MFCRVQDCLNLGVSPKSLIASLRRRFEACGGIIYEQTEFKSAVICPDGVVATLVSAANAPVGVGDTNRPNGLTKEQQQQAKQQQQGGSSVEDEVDGSRSAAAAAAGGRRKAPSKLSCSLLLDCMGELAVMGMHIQRARLLSVLRQAQMRLSTTIAMQKCLFGLRCATSCAFLCILACLQDTLQAELQPVAGLHG
jgi:hypothetical protein